MPNVKHAILPKGQHFIQHRGIETILGFILVIIGCLLLYDAFDDRGKKMIWPLGGLAPW